MRFYVDKLPETEQDCPFKKNVPTTGGIKVFCTITGKECQKPAGCEQLAVFTMTANNIKISYVEGGSTVTVEHVHTNH